MNFEKELLKMLVYNYFQEAEFNRLEVKKEEDGIGVTLEGQAFGIFKALTAAVKAISKASGIPISCILGVIEVGTELAEHDEHNEYKCSNEDNSTSTLFKMFEDFVKESSSEEGKE